MSAGPTVGFDHNSTRHAAAPGEAAAQALQGVAACPERAITADG